MTGSWHRYCSALPLFGRKVDKRLPDLPVAALEMGASTSRHFSRKRTLGSHASAFI
jgi:hypothetical protein